MNKTYSKGRRPVSSKNNKNYNKGLPSLNQSRPMIDPNGTYIPKEDTENLNKTIIDLKRTINNNKADISDLKATIDKLNITLSQKEKEIDELTSVILNSKKKTDTDKILKTSMMTKLRNQYNQALKEIKEQKEEIVKLKKNVNITSYKEKQVENTILLEEMKKIKCLYQISSSKVNETEKLNRDNNILKSELETQHGIIDTLYEKLDFLTKENKRLKKDNNSMMNKSKSDLSSNKFLQNEIDKLQKKLKMAVRNQVENEDWKKERSELYKKVDELTKDLDYYKNQTVIEKSKQPLPSNKKTIKEEENSKDNSYIVNRPPIRVEVKHPEETTDKQLLLLQSIITELREEQKELQAKNQFLEKQLEMLNTSNHMPVQEVKETKPIVQNNKSNQLLIDKIQSNEGKLTTLQEQIISNESNEKINLLFEDVLIVNFENNNISKKSANNLFSYVFSQYTNNIEKDNDDNAKDELISSLVNIISISLHCNNNEKDKKELYDYLSKLYDQDETEEFQQNFYDIFNKVKNHLSTDIIEQDEKNEVSIKQKLSSNKGVIKNIMESFPSTININTLNEILYKNKVYLTKEEYLYLCYKIKHSSGSIRDLSTKELSKLIEEPKPLLNEIIGSGGGPLDEIEQLSEEEEDIYN